MHARLGPGKTGRRLWRSEDAQRMDLVVRPLQRIMSCLFRIAAVALLALLKPREQLSGVQVYLSNAPFLLPSSGAFRSARPSAARCLRYHSLFGPSRSPGGRGSARQERRASHSAIFVRHVWSSGTKPQPFPRPLRHGLATSKSIRKRIITA
jgi:hypothetical protein